jgi:hypothetical protein
MIIHVLKSRFKNFTMKKNIYLFILSMMATTVIFAGNPDRQGEAGAYELLMNPWARSAGLHTMNTSFIGGVEALELNPAGVVRVSGTEVAIGHARYLVGTEINMNAFGIAQKLKRKMSDKGERGSSFGVSIMALDMGEIRETTEDQPEGTGATYSPSWFNIGLTYGYIFENKISVGLTFRGVVESTSEVSAFGFAFDAGVQYVSGPVKFGISLRNIGSPMTFRGQGLSQQRPAPPSEGEYQNTYFSRPQDFELPSQLNIGASYDINIAENYRLTLLGNFTANSFSRDQVGGGIEFSLNDYFMLRGGYRHELGDIAEEEKPLYTGPCAGFSISVPTSKKAEGATKEPSRFGIDYAFRASKVFDGTHNVAIRFNF